jgi:hypothetical protein
MEMFGLFSQRASALIAALTAGAAVSVDAGEAHRFAPDFASRKVRAHGRRNGTHGSTRARRHRSLKAKAGAR